MMTEKTPYNSNLVLRMGPYLLNFSFPNDISRFQVVEVSTSSLGTPRHVRRLPCEDVPVLTKGLDELAFLFDVQCRGNVGGLCVWILWVDMNLLGLASRLGRRINCRLL